MHHEGVFRLRRRYCALRLTSKLVDLRVQYAKRIRLPYGNRATSLKLRNYDATSAKNKNMYYAS